MDGPFPLNWKHASVFMTQLRSVDAGLSTEHVVMLL